MTGNSELINTLRVNVLSGCIAVLFVFVLRYGLFFLIWLYKKFMPDSLKLKMSKKHEDAFTSIIFVLIGLLTTFMLVKTQMDYSHIEEMEADTLTAHYSHYEIRGYRYRHMYIFFSDHDKLLVRWYVGVDDKLNKVAGNEELMMKLHPTGRYVMSIHTQNEEILDFAYIQKKVDTERRAFLIICSVMYLTIIAAVLMTGKSKWMRNVGKRRKKTNGKYADKEYNKKLFNEDNELYQHELLYLGEKGMLTSIDQNIHIDFSYSVRGGMSVRVKRDQPYRILLQYHGKDHCVYDDDNRKYEAWLKTMAEALDTVRSESKGKGYDAIFESLKCCIYDSILDYEVRSDFGI